MSTHGIGTSSAACEVGGQPACPHVTAPDVRGEVGAAGTHRPPRLGRRPVCRASAPPRMPDNKVTACTRSVSGGTKPGVGGLPACAAPLSGSQLF